MEEMVLPQELPSPGAQSLIEALSIRLLTDISRSVRS